MKTGNPALNKNTFAHYANWQIGENMTLDGTVNKMLMLLLLVFIPAGFVWNQVYSGVVGSALSGYIWGGAIIGFILAIITVFKKEWSNITAPLYAIAEGFVLGGLSAMFELMFPGIVIQAVALTFGVAISLLFVYKSGWIKVTDKFRLGVVTATGGIAIIYIVNIVMSMFGTNIPFIHSSGTFGILFSLFVVSIASLNLVLDFDFIEQGVKHKAPKFMEWYAAFGLLVTLVWLYIEILRLLSKIRSR